METERKDVGKVAQGHEQDKEEEGPVLIETVSENGDDESSFGKEVPTRIPVDDKTIREPRPALERVSVQDQRRESPHVPADTANVSRDEKETASYRPVPMPVAGMAHLEEGKGKVCFGCGKIHGPEELTDMLRFVFGNGGTERDPIKLAEAMFGSLPVDWKKADVSNARAINDDKADPVSERFGRFGTPASSGDKEKAHVSMTYPDQARDVAWFRGEGNGKKDPSDTENPGTAEKLGPEEEKKPAYPNVEHLNAKYGFHKRDDEKKKPVPGEETAATKAFFENKAREMADALLNFDSVLGSKGDQTKSETPCTRCGKIHPSSLSGRFFTLRRETPAKKEDEKKEEQGTKTATAAAADTAKKYEDSLAARVASVQKYLDLVGETVVPGTITNYTKEMRFQEEQERRINVALKDMKRAATCKGPEPTFEIIEMLTETKRYVKRDEDDFEYFPQWLYYALKELIFIAKKIVMTKNKYECSRLAKIIDEVYSNPRKEDKAAIKILKYAKGAVTIIAGEVALAFLEK